jgi:hypothetical protein
MYLPTKGVLTMSIFRTTTAHTPAPVCGVLPIGAPLEVLGDVSLEERLTRGMGRAHLHTPIPSAVSGHGAPAEVIPTRAHEARCSIWWGSDGVCDCAPNAKGCFCSSPCGCEFI